MSEEGLEPQELMEQAEKSHHHAEHLEHESDEKSKRFIMRSAITASVLAVGAALASLLSGHAANEAILKTVESSDKWSQYQANSTKAHLFESNHALIVAIKGEAAASSATADFDSKLKKYEGEKEDIRKEAKTLQSEAQKEFDRHLKCSLGVACFQIGIVLSSVGILVRSGWLYWQSIGIGVIGVFCVLVGMSVH
ncbi:MAG TPA: DUF4337 domain-containing protein [Candidatus Obscuribacterales bacterium]